MIRDLQVQMVKWQALFVRRSRSIISRFHFQMSLSANSLLLVLKRPNSMMKTQDSDEEEEEKCASCNIRLMEHIRFLYFSLVLCEK